MHEPNDPPQGGTGRLSTLRPAGIRPAALLAASALLAVICLVLGLRLAGDTEADTPLGRASFDVVPHAFGGIDAYVPIADWGIRADAFEAPFELEIEIRSLDRRGTLEAAGGDQAALDLTREELEGASKAAVLRAFAWAVAVSGIVALLIWLARRQSRDHRTVAAAMTVFAVLGAAASVAAASATFDARAFSSPSYYGRGEELAQLLAFFERQRDNDRYTSTFEGALSNFSAYLADAPRLGEQAGISVFLGSDLHNNVPILAVLRRFVDDHPFFLVGDFAHQGSEAEARTIAPRLAGLADQVVAVSGNHDSDGLMRALSEDGVIVLGEDGRLRADGSYRGTPTLPITGLRVAGFPDPLEWRGDDPDSPRRVFSFPELDDGERLEETAKAELVSWFRGLAPKPDVVLVHQNALAQHLAAQLSEDDDPDPLTILTGHNHYQHIDRYPGGRINVVNAGTLGAGGPLRVGQEPAGLGQLHFRRSDRTLEAVDLIRVEPLSGQTEAERVILDVVCPVEETEQEPCHYEP